MCLWCVYGGTTGPTGPSGQNCGTTTNGGELAGSGAGLLINRTLDRQLGVEINQISFQSVSGH